MSAFYKTSPEDIDLDENNREVTVYVCSDDWGSIYKILTFEQIEEIYQKIKEEA